MGGEGGGSQWANTGPDTQINKLASSYPGQLEARQKQESQGKSQAKVITGTVPCSKLALTAWFVLRLRFCVKVRGSYPHGAMTKLIPDFILPGFCLFFF